MYTDKSYLLNKKAKKTVKVKESITLLSIITCILVTSINIDHQLSSTSFTFLFIITSLVSFILIKVCIPQLESLKLKQIIRNEGPKQHLKKGGTPTMAGIILIPIGVLTGTLASINDNNPMPVIVISGLTLLFMIIGVIDDLLSFSNKSNKGLSSWSKFSLQSIAAIIFLYCANLGDYIKTNIIIFNDQSISLGFLIWPLAFFVLLAESNASNLTDGLDGLASGCSSLIFTGLALHLTINNQINNIELGKFCISMAGACIGFLLLNKNPARVFMGDAGSIPIGASLAGISLITNTLWPLFIMGGVFLAESLSVIIQVTVFKITKSIQGNGLRVFLMAPLHHHFELKGINEKTIVELAWIITTLLIAISFLL